MALTPGTRLGPYEIAQLLGAGGMGEVYCARDTRLDRTVAIKVLASTVAADIALRQRFEREARVISSIEHPNICAVYDVGQQQDVAYIVMQYLEGQTLADRLAAGRALPVAEALAIGMQIAAGLDRAHRAGIVHRDLKPANIMLTKSGAKLLDFGIARVGGSAVGGGASAARRGDSAGETQTRAAAAPITTQGTILGTIHYMAPEQVEGRDADSRADIFALGSVLYEMLTGRRPLDAPTDAGLIAAILEREAPELHQRDFPAGSAPPAAVVQALDRVIRACLVKDVEGRLQSVHDLSLQLAWVAGGVFDARPHGPTARRRRELVAWSLFAVSAAAAIALAATTRRSASPAAPIRFPIVATSAVSFSKFGASPNPAVSPDGRHIVFEMTDDTGDFSLAIRTLDNQDARRFAGTEHAAFPFWSADSRFIGFFAGGRLRRMSVDGGPSQEVCPVSSIAGGTWNQTGTILYGGGRLGIRQAPATGGSASPVTTLDAAAQEAWHEWPTFLPDGRRFLYTAGPPGAIYLASLDSPGRVKIADADSKAVFANGHLLFMRKGVLLAQAFDPPAGRLLGEPTPVVPDVGFDLANSHAAAAFSASDGGVLVYRTGTAASVTMQLQWFDLSGKALGTVGPTGTFLGIDLSPDDTRIAAHRHDPDGGDVWIIDAPSGTTSRFTFDATRHHTAPFWSRDGRHIGYGSTIPPRLSLLQRPSNGAGSEAALDHADLGLIPGGWTPDGQALLYSKADLKTRWDIWAVPVGGDRPARALIQGPSSEMLPQVSPDGRWLAYQASDSGRNEIYVQPYPSLNGKWQVSAEGGSHVRWRRDGLELYYLAPGNVIMAVNVEPARAAFGHGPPRRLFSADMGVDYGINYPYAVSRDGRRILVETVVKDDAVATMVLTANWTNLLKR